MNLLEADTECWGWTIRVDKFDTHFSTAEVLLGWEETFCLYWPDTYV